MPSSSTTHPSNSQQQQQQQDNHHSNISTSSIIQSLSSHLDISPTKSILSTLNNTMTRTPSIVSNEARNTKISPTSSEDCPREGVSTSNGNNSTNTTDGGGTYHTKRYEHLPPTTQNYTTSHNTRTKLGQRCYRLNLERPFNIHCEQSPLEYGDIFKPWDKSVRPKTRGPVEYCPPRHLGGNEIVWRRMLTFDSSGGVSGGGGGEEKEGVEEHIGWRELTPKEHTAIHRLGERTESGEYSFVTYDLVHQPHIKSTNNNNGGNSEQPSIITPTNSTDSSDSSQPQSTTQKANETARLFRRSELSLREKAEEEQRQLDAEKKRMKQERKEREQKELEELKSVKGAKGVSKRMSKRASLKGKKVLRRLSSSFSNNSSSTRTMRGGIYEGGVTGRRKLVSTQAGMIEKARDVIDEDSDGEYDGEKYDDKKKITNMSLFIIGEYDVLNDLCLDGGPRLKNSQNQSDLQLLLQNDPCPPPNRWVRKTGWGKCNPSSMYAECPPEGFDLVGYVKRDGPVKVNPVPRPVMEVKAA